MILLTSKDPLPGVTYGKENFYETEVSQDSAGTSDFVLLASFIQYASVAVYPTGGSCKVQTTSDTVENLEAGTAVWEDWPAGSVSSAKSDVAAGVKAIRLVVSSGSARMVIAQEV